MYDIIENGSDLIRFPNPPPAAGDGDGALAFFSRLALYREISSCRVARSPFDHQQSKVRL